MPRHSYTRVDATERTQPGHLGTEIDPTPFSAETRARIPDAQKGSPLISSLTRRRDVQAPLLSPPGEATASGPVGKEAADLPLDRRIFLLLCQVKAFITADAHTRGRMAVSPCFGKRKRIEYMGARTELQGLASRVVASSVRSTSRCYAMKAGG